MKKLIFILFIGYVTTSCLQTRTDIESAEEKKAIQSQVQVLQRTKADQDAQYQALQEDIRSLGGRLEALEHQGSQKKVGDQDANQKITALTERVKQLETANLQLEQDIASLKKTPPATAASSGGDKKGMFNEAEQLYGEKNWKKAMTAYQKFREVHPKDKNAATATLKIGICFQELGMSKEARIFYEETIEKYPESKSAGLAKTRLAQLGKK